MKIIGKTEDGFILEASKPDVAAFENLYSHQKTFNVGDLIDVSKLFNKLECLQSALNNIERLKEATETLYSSCEWIKNFIDN